MKAGKEDIDPDHSEVASRLALSDSPSLAGTSLYPGVL